GSVEAFLEELQDRSPDKGGALVQLLPKAPGAREARWAHLLCGVPVLTGAPVAHTTTAAVDADWQERLSSLEQQVQTLQAQVQQLMAAQS
ncbi:MAG: DUF480 domain-containing protein, partial [Comamonas sp.]|nr:DUF480 domain-containing protein [Candidatus Comamonas equi]